MMPVEGTVYKVVHWPAAVPAEKTLPLKGPKFPNFGKNRTAVTTAAALAPKSMVPLQAVNAVVLSPSNIPGGTAAPAGGGESTCTWYVWYKSLATDVCSGGMANDNDLGDAATTGAATPHTWTTFVLVLLGGSDRKGAPY